VNDNERAQKSFDLAAETTKQLISLSTAIITVTIAFAKDFFGSRQSGLEWLLALAWLLYLISLISGIFTLMGLTGQLSSSNQLPSIYARPIKLFSIGQILTFISGTVAIVIFGIFTIGQPNSSTNKQSALPIGPSSTLPQKAPSASSTPPQKQHNKFK
jgi:hypothetical protein